MLDCELLQDKGISNNTAVTDTTGIFITAFNCETYQQMYGRVKVYLHAFLSMAINRGKRLHGSDALFIKRGSRNRLDNNRDSKVYLDKVPKTEVRGPYGNRTSIVLTVAWSL
jgi:hypothetical protein